MNWLALILHAFGVAEAYLVVANSGRLRPDRLLFEAAFFEERGAPRTYRWNANKSAAFVDNIIRVQNDSGDVILKEKLTCDGVKHPNVFTVFVDSFSNGSYEYVSIPLRIYVRDCAVQHSDDFSMEEYSKITDIKQWTSQSIVSYALPGSTGMTPSFDPLWETCFRQSEFIARLGNYVIPKGIWENCFIKYADVSDARISIEANAEDLVASHDFCIPLDPPWIVNILLKYSCDRKFSSMETPFALIYPDTHQIKMIFWRRKEANEVGRFRRDLQNGASTDVKTPQFDKSLYMASVSEEQPPGTSVCTVFAKSNQENGEISYQMIPLLDGRSHSMFAMDSKTGVVTTSVSLDREQLDVHYFRIQAVDLLYRPYSATTTLQINVQDINDHAPAFEISTGQYEASIRESAPIGSVVLTIRATDKDIGRNAQIEYEIRSIDGAGMIPAFETEEGAFSLDATSGVLTTRIALDRETTQVYTIIAAATDKALPVSDRKSCTATIVVRVTDENDNYPQFSERAYTIGISEDTSPNDNPVLASVKATDDDEGQNAAIRYAIIGGNTQSQFSIDSQSGDVTLVKSLDYESTKSYRLIIRAQDGGSPSRSNTTQILVNVKDANDNAPRFYANMFQESVLENVPVGFSIVRIQAYDADEGENAAIKYSIPVGNFVVDATTGWIRTSKVLDREASGKFQFQAVAEDGGGKSATAEVVITVQDVNDNDPQFSPKNYEATVSESDSPGTPVTAVSASDPDENPRLHYEIADGNLRGRFAITTQNGRGLITIAQPLDYKQERRFVLSVRAMDSGGKFDTATVYVNVSDANNFAPVFENAPYSASVLEDVPVGATVLVVSAVDSDAGENARITYALSDGGGGGVEFFAINAETGAIVTAKALDRETQGGYLLTVSAKDGGMPGLSDTTDVEISVADVNDNAPTFLSSAYAGSVSEDVLVGTSVLQVSATDIDSGLNGRFYYALEKKVKKHSRQTQIEDSLENESEGVVEAFAIDSASGVIRTATPLDRESTPRYELRVLCIDRGNPPLTATTTVVIRVEDVNDSPPAFESDKLTFYIAENSPIGSVVGLLDAKDPDEGANAVVQYAIIAGEDANAFSLAKPKAGGGGAELITLVEMDYESNKKKFELVVRATSAPLRNDARIEIFVTDVNDNAPRLKDFQVIFNNYEDSFPPRGEIGRIPATDADVADSLRYKILSGNNANFVRLNASTGQLTLSPLLNTNVAKTAMFEVSVSDGINEAKATMQLMVRLVTEEMLFSSVVVRLKDMTQEAFLSPVLVYFVEGLAAIIPCPKENVYIFSVTENAPDTFVGDFLGSKKCEENGKAAKILNVAFSARKADGSFFSSQYLQERIYLNRMNLNKLSTLQVLPFEDTLCVREPCLNFERCLSVLKFGNASSDFISSESVLFRPIYPVSTFACICPKGFTGRHEHYLCDAEINACYSNPCLNGGTCERTEGSYVCSCPSDFSGENCGIKTALKHDTSCSAPKLLEELERKCRGLRIYDPECQKSENSCRVSRARSFPKNSFLTFPSLKQRNRLRISLKFSTLEDEGLFLYNGRYNDLHDFIALELTDGGRSVKFSFSLGDEGENAVTTVTASIQKTGLNDGQWHKVDLAYYNKAAKIFLDDCDADLTLKHGPQLGLYCANVSSRVLESRCDSPTETCHRFLDLTGPLQIGGLPMLPSSSSLNGVEQATNYGVIRSKDFIGCISDVYIDYKLLNLNDFVADNNTVPGCPEKRPHCSSAVEGGSGELCKNGATCFESWSMFQCECKDGWGGRDCSDVVGSAWSFRGDGKLSFNPLLRQIQLPWMIGLSVRTYQQNAFLMAVQIGQENWALLTLQSGYLTFAIDGQIAALTTGGRLNNGLWHRLEISLGGESVRMTTDYGKRSSSRPLQNANIQGLYAGKIVVGSFLSDYRTGENNEEGGGWMNLILDPLQGCISDIRIGSGQTLQRPTEMERVQEGCGDDGGGKCGDLCPANSDCITQWRGHACKCHSGYVGPNCEDVCAVANPCYNGGQCVRDQSQSSGYRCVCDNKLFSGDHCEIEIEQGCPVSWWGHPVCGPCNCPLHLGYNPNCNTTTGQCFCQEKHYKPEHSDRCIPCDCYTEGSFDASCDLDSGQCRCRPKVVGRRCDSCPNGFAEVTSSSGCQVVYDGCPRNFASGIWWSRTPFGKTAVESCPSDAQGSAIRPCVSGDERHVLDGGWETPDTFNCTGHAFVNLRKLVEELDGGISKLDADLAVESANFIGIACNVTEGKELEGNWRKKSLNSLYGMDVFATQKLISKLLSYESSQNGLNLTHSQDKDYIKNIASGLSRILAADEWEHWKRIGIEQVESLIEVLGSYLVILATNQRDTYTEPFEVVTPHFAIGLDTATYESLPSFEKVFKGHESNVGENRLKRNSPDSVKNNSFSHLLSSAETSLIFENESSFKVSGLRGPAPFLTSANIPSIAFPKYDNYLPPVKRKFDPYSRIFVPVDLLSSVAAHKENDEDGITIGKWAGSGVVGYAHFAHLGKLLPLRFDDTVTKRYGIELAVGSTMMKVVAASNQEGERFTNNARTASLSTLVPLPVPIKLQMWLNYYDKGEKEADMTAEVSRFNPQCVRWTWARGFGEWTRAGCLTTIPDSLGISILRGAGISVSTITEDERDRRRMLVNCTCDRFAAFAVLVDVVDAKYSSLEMTLAEDFVFWFSFGGAIFVSTLTYVLLRLLRANTNSCSIRLNLTACVLLTQCLFLFAAKSNITIVTNEISCRMSAMGLHYLWLSAMSWSFVCSLHLYRMLTEMRDVNHGQMGFYHAIGYGLPAIVTGLSVGVRADQYGNYAFCWLSLYEPVVWSLVGPVCALVACNLIMLLLSLKAAFTLKDHVAGFGNLRSLLWLSVVNLPLLVTVWMLELLVATERDFFSTYLLCAAVLLQSCFSFGAYCCGNATVRANVLGKIWCRGCCGELKIPPTTPATAPSSSLSPAFLRRTAITIGNAATLPKSSLSYNQQQRSAIHTVDGEVGTARQQLGVISTSSTTSRSSTTHTSPYGTRPRVINHGNGSNNFSTSYEHSEGALEVRKKQRIAKRMVEEDSDSEGRFEGKSLDLASSHSSDEEESTATNESSCKFRGKMQAARGGFLPNIVEDVVGSNQRFPPPLPPQPRCNSNLDSYQQQPIYQRMFYPEEPAVMQKEEEAVSYDYYGRVGNAPSPYLSTLRRRTEEGRGDYEVMPKRKTSLDDYQAEVDRCGLEDYRRPAMAIAGGTGSIRSYGNSNSSSRVSLHSGVAVGAEACYVVDHLHHQGPSGAGIYTRGRSAVVDDLSEYEKSTNEETRV